MLKMRYFQFEKYLQINKMLCFFSKNKKGKNIHTYTKQCYQTKSK